MLQFIYKYLQGFKGKIPFNLNTSLLSIDRFKLANVRFYIIISGFFSFFVSILSTNNLLFALSQLIIVSYVATTGLAFFIIVFNTNNFLIILNKIFVFLHRNWDSDILINGKKVVILNSSLLDWFPVFSEIINIHQINTLNESKIAEM